ncbi:MAG: sigma-70 family RNA polymerase sigma factor [Planctomycetota bacterium]
MLTTSKTLLENISLLDPNAWEDFVKTYYPIIHKWVRKFIPNREDAEDKIQDIFMAIHTSIIRFEHRGKGTFRKWLKTICFRKIIDYQRNLKTTISTEFLISMDSLEASEIGMEWDSNYVEKTTESAMNFVKMRFSKDDWDIFYRIFVNQEKAAEVAASLNVSKNVVYIVHCRVKQKFTEILKELTDEL